MENNGKRKKQKTVTFRIDEDIINMLYNQSDIDSISLNSLVNHVLRRYVEWNRYEDTSSMTPIASVVLKKLLDTFNKDQVIKLANDIGKNAIYNIILFMNGKIDIETMISWYMQRMKYCSEISDKLIDINNNRKIIFKHQLGENWSLYHKTIIESICQDILSNPIKVEITDSTIILNFK